MSRLARLLQPVAAGRRPYSIFSSKSGGGRYFNSSKPAKVIAPAKSSASGTSNVAQSTTGSPGAPEPSEGPVSEEISSKAQHAPERLPDAKQTFLPAFTPRLSSADPQPFAHPTLKPNELTLHHFFSMHRPYLLINHPTSMLFESAPPPQPTSSSALPASLGTIDNPPVASPEADADSARQIGRAMVLNRVGNTVDWSETLTRLGFQGEMAPLPADTARIDLDSTKRKRRKKMKKHKLKKRRRLQRSLRLRLGK